MLSPDNQGLLSVQKSIHNQSGDQLFFTCIKTFQSIRNALKVSKILLKSFEAEVFVFRDGESLVATS